MGMIEVQDGEGLGRCEYSEGLPLVFGLCSVEGSSDSAQEAFRPQSG